MHFKSLNIKNYRGIGENCLKVDNFGDINIFTGKNNSGKSTLLEAIFQVANVVNANGTISELYQARQSLIVQNSDLLPMFYMLNTNNSPFFEVQIKNTKTIRIRKVKIEANRDNVIEMNQINSIAIPNKLKGINFKLEINNNLEFESTVNIIPTNVNLLIGQMTNIQIHQDIKKNNKEIKFAEFLSSATTINNLAIKLYEILKKDESKSFIIKSLQNIDAKITDIEVDTAKNKIELKIASDVYLPVNFMGDGIVKLLKILIKLIEIEVQQDGILIIDEIENGLHYSFYPELWRIIINLVENKKLQLFIATHSSECLNSLVEILKENGNNNKDVMLYTLKYENDKHWVAEADTKTIIDLYKGKFEVR